MNALEVMLERHQRIFNNIDGLFDQLSQEQVRTKPRDDVNSVAWLLWHIGRCTDVGNRLVTGCPQELDEGNWAEKMNIPLRNYGTGMSDEEVTALSQRINIQALRDYLSAVSQHTVEILKSLEPEKLDEPIGAAQLQKVLIDEGVLGANADWVPARYAEHSKGSLLAHLSVTHNFSHFGAAEIVCGLLGIRARPEDGEVRAVPDWEFADLPV